MGNENRLFNALFRNVPLHEGIPTQEAILRINAQMLKTLKDRLPTSSLAARPSAIGGAGGDVIRPSASRH